MRGICPGVTVSPAQALARTRTNARVGARGPRRRTAALGHPLALRARVLRGGDVPPPLQDRDADRHGVRPAACAAIAGQTWPSPPKRPSTWFTSSRSPWRPGLTVARSTMRASQRSACRTVSPSGGRPTATSPASRRWRCAIHESGEALLHSGLPSCRPATSRGATPARAPTDRAPDPGPP